MYKKIARICLALTGLIILWDIILACTGKPTISATTLYMAQHGHFALPFMCGFLMAHLFIPWKKKVSWGTAAWLVICMCVIALDVKFNGSSAGVVVLMSKYPLIPFFAGMPVGCLFQQKDKSYAT